MTVGIIGFGLENCLFHTAQLAIIALGITLGSRAAGFFSFLPAGSALVCPFIIGGIFDAGVPLIAAFLLGLAIAGALAWLGWSAMHRPAANADIKTPWAQLLLSLGAYYVVKSCCALVFGDDLKILPKVAGGRTFWQMVALTIFVTSAVGVTATAWGREWRALATNRDLSIILGLPVRRRQAEAFVGGAILCALGALAYAADTGYHPGYELPIFFRGITVAVIGGLGRPWGLAAGATCVAVTQQTTAYYLGAQWIDAATFGILVGFLILRPLGFSGRRLKKVEV